MKNHSESRYQTQNVKTLRNTTIPLYVNRIKSNLILVKQKIKKKRIYNYIYNIERFIPFK